MGCPDWFLFKEDARATIRKTHDFLQVQTEKTFGSRSSVLSCSHFINFLKRKPPDCDTIFAIKAVDSFWREIKKVLSESDKTFFLAGAPRIELGTRGFGDRCSTCWAIPLFLFDIPHGEGRKMCIWYAWCDSNARPSESESDTLSSWATGAYRKNIIRIVSILSDDLFIIAHSQDKCKRFCGNIRDVHRKFSENLETQWSLTSLSAAAKAVPHHFRQCPAVLPARATGNPTAAVPNDTPVPQDKVMPSGSAVWSIVP